MYRWTVSFLFWLEEKKEGYYGRISLVAVKCAPFCCFWVCPIWVETKCSKFSTASSHVIRCLLTGWIWSSGREILSLSLPSVHTLWLRAKYFPLSAPPFSQWVHTICQHQCLPHAKQFSSIYITSTRNFPRTLHEAMFDLMSSNWRITCSTVKRVLYFQKAACPGWMSAAVRGSERSSTS